MSKKKYSISVERGLGCAVLGVILLDIASKAVKQENKFIPYNLRNWMRGFNTIAQPVLWEISKLKKLFVPAEKVAEINNELGYELESESIESDLNTEQSLFTDFIFTYLNSDTSQIYNLALIMENLKEGKKVYTEQEVEDVVNKTLKTITPAVKYDVNTYKRFIV